MRSESCGTGGTEAVPDFALLADPNYVIGEYRKRQLLDAAAYGLGVGRDEEGPTGDLLDDSRRLSGDLRVYMREAWHVLEPHASFSPNWHLDAIADHLTAISRGELRDLVINIPPRCTKSLSVSVLWMTWEWTWRPWTQWLFSAYVDRLAIRDSVKCRRLIQSPWYQERWGHLFQLTGDQNEKIRFDNNRGGYRIASSVAGSVTGEGANRLVLDDPHDPQGAESETQRETTLRWIDETWSTRRNNPLKDARVVMMQRLHQKDATGHILSTQDGWEHLMIPMRYDPKRSCVTSIGWTDPRKTEGELLHPERFPEHVLRQIEKPMGPYGVAGQMQQEPVARSGGQFERAWFLQDYDYVPKGSAMIWVRAWDAAGTHGGGKYTAGVRIGVRVTDGMIFVAHVERGQWGAGPRNAIILATAQNDAELFGTGVNGTRQPNKRAVLHRFEQEPGSGGKDQAKSFLRLLRGYRCEAEPSTGDKFTRADPFAGACKNGDVHVLPGPWREAFLDEMEAAGPGAEFLDQMDGSSSAYNRLMALWDQHKNQLSHGVDMSQLTEDNLRQDSRWEVL